MKEPDRYLLTRDCWLERCPYTGRITVEYKERQCDPWYSDIQSSVDVDDVPGLVAWLSGPAAKGEEE